jgi:predicted nucleic acid-binding protein
MEIRSISFDTSFLLHKDTKVDRVISILEKDKVPTYISTTVLYEIETLMLNGRIDDETYQKSNERWKRLESKMLDFQSHFLSERANDQCVASMRKNHGVPRKEIFNDCQIITESMIGGVDVFVSEDYHFTSKLTENVLDDIVHIACKEYKEFCEGRLYTMDTKTFLKAYADKKIDLDIVKSKKKLVKKFKKYLRTQQAVGNK